MIILILTTIVIVLVVLLTAFLAKDTLFSFKTIMKHFTKREL